MKEKIANYIYDESIPFVFLGTSHVFSIILFIVLALSIPYLAKKNLNENQQYFLRKNYWCYGIVWVFKLGNFRNTSRLI